MNFPEGSLSPEGYIISQAAFKDVAFKDSTIAATGCGVIAIYNAMHRLCMAPDFEDIKKYICNTCITTRLGTNPLQVVNYLRKKGIYRGIYYCKNKFSDVRLGLLLYSHKQGCHWTMFYKVGDKFRFLNVSRGLEEKRLTMDEFLRAYSIRFIKCVIKIK